MKRALILLLALLLLLPACSGGVSPDVTETAAPANDGNVRMPFAEAIDVKRIAELAGKTVEIVGYMATVSPVSGKYMYLMNLPYQSCPYCVPNTQQLSNTIAVYAKEGDKFGFTDGPINVTGTLETGDFEDEYGYTYGYRIKDAVYSEVNSKESSAILAQWEKISNAGVASDVYSMFDFLDFECNWPNYRATFADGEAFLYPADVTHFESTQYKKESAADYFDSLAERAKKIDVPVMDELVQIIQDAKALKDKAAQERADENYTYDRTADKYTLTNGEILKKSSQDLYVRFAQWLENFSLSK